MWVAFAAVTFAATFAAVLAAVHRVRRRPFALELTVALAVTICLETAIMNVLSPFHAVTRGWLAGVHVLATGIAWSVLGPRAIADVVRRGARAIRRLGWAGVVLGPVAALALLSALRYAPNSWDSMSYHLARVAHWIQHGSVASYDTNIVRQVALQPGAEYLLLVLQVVSGVDRLAGLIQLGAWVAVVLAAPVLARVAGAPKRVSIAAAPIVAAAPMLVLQASSTQNDLVAAVAAIAGVVASMPFLHRAAGRWRIADAALLGLVLAAAALVKLTATLAVLPVVLVGLVQSVRRLSSRAEAVHRAAAGVGVLLVVASAFALPDVLRRGGDARLSPYVARFTYPVLGEFADRGWNLVRATFRHVPAPRSVAAAVGIPERCVQTGWLSSDAMFEDHEEYAGNTLLALFALGAAGLGVLRWRSLPGRARLFLSTTVAAWILFQLTFRDNEWISRLELPVFALSGVFLASAAGWRTRHARFALACSVAVAIVAAASGTVTAARNRLRPPLRAPPLDVNGAESYYVELPELRWAHDAALSSAHQLGCRRLGLALHEDSWDYPLTWRAMEQGIEVRHVLGADPWPCLVYVESQPAPPETLRWIRTSVPFLFVNGATGGARR